MGEQLSIVGQTNRQKLVAPVWCAFSVIAANAIAQQEEITVYGVTPTQSVTLPEEKIPYNVQTASAEDIERTQSLALSDFLNSNFGSVNLNDAQNNPLQPDLQYRGYTASPLLGLAQGVAVYQNGARINEPLGDTVNWDLVPQSAIHSVNLIGGSHPVFGLNTLGGALVLQMKNGFNTQGHKLTVSGGSFDRIVTSVESGGNNGSWGYFANVHYFDEDGWRDESASDAINFYGSVGWRGEKSDLNLNIQRGTSDLLGNGAVPVELLDIDRSAIFTAPDRTENDLTMIGIDGVRQITDNVKLTVNAFHRENETDAFNGDASEFSVCTLGGADRLLEGLEEDGLEAVGLDNDDVCVSQFADVQALEDFLNATAMGMGVDDEFNLDDLTDELSGAGALSDEAINNISNRKQESFGIDVQLSFDNDLYNKGNLFIAGVAYYKGNSAFDSVTELSNLNPDTRSTAGLGTGLFVDEFETNIDTETETVSFYFLDAIELTDKLTLTLAGRVNDTNVELMDRSGERPELNGKHSFTRFNPSAGATYQFSQNVNVYGNYSESSRAPTPLELACNDSIFDLAVAAAIAAGEDPGDVEFECRLPNAFLADPPLKEVVTKGFEVGIRGQAGATDYHLGVFRLSNKDDIIFQTTGRSTGLFANVDETRRTGIETQLSGATDRVEWSLAYTYLKATFEDSFQALSPNHPFADDDGEISVSAGDRIPGLPEHSWKLGADYELLADWTVGFNLLYNSDQVLRGDESNQIETVSSYVLLDLRSRYRVNDNIEFSVRVSNLLDRDYETFGLLGEEPSEVDVPLFEDFSNPRFVGPASPRAIFVGVTLSMQ